MAGLVRLVLILFIGWIAYSLFRRWLAGTSSSAGRKQDIGQMVRCAKCGLHFPRQEAFTKHERYYCCRDHMQQDQH